MLVFGGVRFWCKKSQSAGILLGGNKSLKVAAGTQENVPKFKVDTPKIAIVQAQRYLLYKIHLLG